MVAYEEEDFPGGEIGRVLAADSAEEYRKIALQNAEDAAREYGPPTYMGIVGRREPDGGWIFEP